MIRRVAEKAAAGLAFILGEPEIEETDSNNRRPSYGEPTWKLLQITKHSSYHGTISNKVAEFMLKKQESDNCYLTRYWEHESAYSISVLSRTVVQHFILNISNAQNGCTLYEIEGTEEKFSDISALLSFYQRTPINRIIDSIGEEVKCVTNETPRKASKKESPSSRNHPYSPKRPRLSSQVADFQEDYKEPRLGYLLVFPWQDERGKRHQLRTISQISKKWRDIGMLLEIEGSELENYEGLSGRDANQCCSRVFRYWFDNSHVNYPVTWTGVYNLLVDIEMATAATRLKEALDRHVVTE